MKPSSESFKQAIDTLKTARDEARVRAHLLSMDGRKKWAELETKVEAFEQELSGQAEKVGDASAKVAHELTRAVHDFAEKHFHKH